MNQSRTVHLADSSVMGGLAVTVTGFCLALAGISQLLGGPGSRVIGEAGGGALDVTWSLCLIAALVPLLVARRLREPEDRALMEVLGIVLIVAGLVTYVWAAVTASGGLSSRGVLIALSLAAATNLTGRAVLLMRRVWWVRGASQ